MIPITDPKSQLKLIKQDLLHVFSDVLENGQYILGPYVDKLEKRIAKRLGVFEAIGVASGTDALVLALEAYGIGKGDEVITTPFTFFATAEAITRVGATPVFVDVEQDTFNLNPHLMKEKITSASKAIIPVHIFGQPANMDEIVEIAHEHDLVVIEDACQAFGATYQGKEVGSLGDVACFSFFPTKNLSTMGDGGLVVTDNPDVAEKIRTLRAHGSKQKYYHQEIGYNSRLEELHAAILLICLDYIDQWNQQRITLAKRYLQALNDVPFLQLPETNSDVTHVYHLFCLQSDFRTAIMDELKAQHIQTGIYYPRCLHLQEAYRDLPYQKGDFPVAEDLSEKIFAIPLYPNLSFADQDLVIEALKNVKVNQ